jgi:hypothetical protein
MNLPFRKTILFLAVLLICQVSFSQKMLMLSKLGNTNHRYFSFDDHIDLKTHPSNLKVRGLIAYIGDTSMILGKSFNVPYKDIAAIRQDVYWPGIVSKISLIAGAGYLALDVVNNLINNEQVFDPSTLYISGALIGFGLVLIPLSHRYVPIGVRWKLTVMDQPVHFR